MITLISTEELEDFCDYAKGFPYITIDTEFLREKTYYAKLCLVQLALPGSSEKNSVLVDPLIDEEFSFEPLFKLFKDTNITKVFHAGRQDLEIFFNIGEIIPEPLFDTQIAAMVCGFGEQVSYEILVKKILNVNIDKTSRFSDWSRRPLTRAQENYAITDVTHLRGVYEYLERKLLANKRISWISQEMGILMEKNTYVTNPRDIWKKVKVRNKSPKFLTVIRELAAYRDIYAKNNNIPRTRVFKDDALLELASSKPKNINDLQSLRLLNKGAKLEPICSGILRAIDLANNCPSEDLPKLLTPEHKIQKNDALIDLLKVLLKAVSDKNGVAQRLIASVSELEDISRGQAGLPSMLGWRYEIFGRIANDLCEGKISLGVERNEIKILEVNNKS